jgi:6,7-dimethyl-8-ribityllumazine synthase
VVLVQGKTLSPILTARGVRLAVAVGRFNERVTKLLLEGALEAYARLGGDPKEVLVVWVPGSFELPLVAKRLAQRPDVDAVVALGAVIRGETPHFEYVAAQAAGGLMQAMLQTEKPIVFGGPHHQHPGGSPGARRGQGGEQGGRRRSSPPSRW